MSALDKLSLSTRESAIYRAFYEVWSSLNHICVQILLWNQKARFTWFHAALLAYSGKPLCLRLRKSYWSFLSNSLHDHTCLITWEIFPKISLNDWIQARRLVPASKIKALSWKYTIGHSYKWFQNSLGMSVHRKKFENLDRAFQSFRSPWIGSAF